MSEVNTAAETRLATKSRLRALGVGILLGASLAGTYKEVGSENTSQEKLAPAANNPLESCSTPSFASVMEVDKLFDQSYKPGETPLSAEAARQYGLHVKDPIVFIGNSLGETTTERAAQLESFVARANRFLGQYGVKMTVGYPGYETMGWHKPTDEQMANDTTPQTIENIVYGIGSLPIEYVHLSGLKKIVLLANEKEDKNVAAFAPQDKGLDTIVFNLAGYGSANTIDHEVYHLLDFRECGGPAAAGRDPGYIRLNTGDIYPPLGSSRSASPDKLSYDSPAYQGPYRKRLEHMARDVLNHNRKDYCQEEAFQSKDDKKVVVMTDYAFTNVLEDKAEMGAMFVYPQFFGDFLDESRPTLRNKFQFLMARLYDRNPNLVRYFAAIGSIYKNRREPFDCEA